MNDNELRELLQSQPIAEANELSKARHKKAALAAFREAQAEKTSAPAQGMAKAARLTHAYTPVRNKTMFSFSNRTWFSAAAASVILVVGLMTFGPDFTQIPHPPAELSETRAGGEIQLEAGEIKEFKKDSAKLYPAPVPAIETQSEADALVDRLEPELAAPAAAARAKPKSLAPGRIMAEAESVDRSLTQAKELQRESIQNQMEDRDRFARFQENTIKLTSEHPVSTFAIDVDTASYSYVRRQLNQGVLPRRDSVRIEEMINYFDYAYTPPTNKQVPFATHVNVMPSPWRPGNQLIQIAIKGYELQQQPNSNLVFLLDVSGSMDSPDKLPLVKQSMGLLLDHLKPTDTVAIVVYAGAAGTVLEPTPAAQKQVILNALNRLQAGGSTAGSQGLALAYAVAESSYKKGAVNRIILATDGDFNLGITQDERLEDYVKRQREKGVYLSVLGFGQGNYQDALTQTLAQNGNGIAAYIDTLSEAQKVLVHQATSTLFPIANDVKIQLEFNPATVAEYRLIGYETRALNREDFNNDQVDAGDIGAGHTVTAIYEITPLGSAAKQVDDLRYSSAQAVANDHPSNEYAFLKLRYKLPGETNSNLISTPILKNTEAAPLIQREMRFATAVAAFGQSLSGSHFGGDFSLDQIIALAQANKGEDEYGYRSEFIQLVRLAKTAN